jgi:hypothetical protein
MSKNYIENHKRGTYWDGAFFLFEEEDIPSQSPNEPTFSPLNLTGIAVSAHLKETENGSVVLEFKQSDLSLTVPDPLSGKIFLMPRPIDIPECTYILKIVFDYGGGRIEEPISNFWTIE